MSAWQPPPFPRTQKGRSTPVETFHGRTAPWRKNLRSKNGQRYSVCLSVCLIIAPAMGLSRKIGGFLMAGASFSGSFSLLYHKPGRCARLVFRQKRTIAPPASAAKAPAPAAAARIIMQNRHKAPGTDENYLFRKTILRQTADLCAASCEKSCSF